MTSTQPTIDRIPCLGPRGFHRIALARWQSPGAARPVLCVHGLTRNGRDFDDLAKRLATKGPVFAPDMAGRGKSDWLPSGADYAYPLYIADTAAIIAAIGAEEIDFVGTSMGGIIGMMLAAQPNSPIRRLILNDVGGFIPKAALARIGTYVGRDPVFPTLAALEAYLRGVAASFGPLTDAQWAHLTAYGHRALETGGFGLAYDPAIGAAFQVEPQDVTLWPVYDAIRCPTLVIRGSVSDLLTADTAAEMTTRGPKARVYEVAGVGHAPALMAEDQIAVIEGFLGA